MKFNVNNLLGALTTTDIIVLSVVALFFVLMVVIGAIRLSKKRKEEAEIASREVDDVTIKHGVRYTDDMTIVTKDGDTNISYGKHDCILKQNETYIASKKGYVHPGKYTILATKDDEETFNVRIGTYVKEYRHGQEVVLTDGEEVTPVSTDIILR